MSRTRSPHRSPARTRQALARRIRAQAMTEFVWLCVAMLVGTGSIMVFAPDMLAAFTIYVRGFYVILGYPIG